MDEPLHLPDFIMPDFTQPRLEQVDLSMPNFTLPDPERSGLADFSQMPPWPEDLDRLATDRVDAASPDLLEPDKPTFLTQPDTQVHMLPQPVYEPEVVMQERLGELDPAAREIVLGSLDREELPEHITYPQLYTTQDEMSRRKRHLGMLELGLEQIERDEW
jgi:hypothetical protein